MTEKTLGGYEPVVVQHAALQLLQGNPAFEEAKLRTELEIISEWASSEENDTKARERAFTKLMVLNEVLMQIDTFYSEVNTKNE